MDKKRLTLVGIGIVAVAALIGAVIVFGPWGDGEEDDGTLDAADPATLAAMGFAANWSSGNLQATRFTAGSGDAAAINAITTAGLGAVGPGPNVELLGITRLDDRRATGDLMVTWDLGDGRSWAYPTTVDLAEEEGTWLVDWVPATVEPSLQSGEVLRASRTPGSRGRILDLEGNRLTAGESTVKISIRKEGVEDPRSIALTVAALTGVDGEELAARVEAAGPTELVEVTSLPRSEYDRIRDQVHPLAGTRFDETNAEPASVSPGYASAVIGSMGIADAEFAERSDGQVREGERTGLSGLQASQNSVLAGAPGLTIDAVPPEGVRRALKSYPAIDGRDVIVTLDASIQAAADSVLADVEEPAAVVAIRVSTGDIVAISNGRSSYDRASLGRYAPGSAFKIVSAYALGVHAGIGPDTIVDCPETITVGKTFRNADGSGLGTVPFRTDFARSCNTAFIGRSSEISADDLTDAATALGYRDLDIGLPVITPSTPTDGDATEHAAQMIGQGRIEGSVIHVALASATVAAGAPVIPRLVVDHPVSTGSTVSDLDSEVLASIGSMMRSVVTEGTGSALAAVPGGEVSAKTGTAEFGSEVPPQTHAWITGFQGDIAFAVVVEGGGSGGAVAGPIAASFLTRLAG